MERVLNPVECIENFRSAFGRPCRESQTERTLLTAKKGQFYLSIIEIFDHL